MSWFKWPWRQRQQAAPAPLPSFTRAPDAMPKPGEDMLGATTLRQAADARGTAVPDACLELVARFEGFGANAYRCPAGVWTIGYGMTRWPSGLPVQQGDTITQPRAFAMLRDQLQEFAAGVDRLVTVPITAHERGAIISLAYNIGLGALRESTLLRLLNAGDKPAAAAQFKRWTKAAGRELPGLTTRRNAEAVMFRVA
jgi:lysozyme